MSKKCFFSIVLCVNKYHEFLDKAIESILGQNYEDYFEFIIVANNCSDDLYSHLETFNDDRIKLYRTCIGQLTFNLNYAINEVSGEYIIRMDADDISLPNRLKTTYNYLQSRDFDLDVVSFSSLLINESDELLGENILPNKKLAFKDILFSNPIIHPATAIKKTAILKCSGYSGGFQSEDYDLWIRMLRESESKYKIHSSSEVVLKYRLNEGQSRGNLLPYCENASYMLRELLLKFTLMKFLGLIAAVFKRYIKH